MTDFHGVKIALLLNDKLVMILRDNNPNLRFANMWDFPGGGREGNETPEECARRELKEELSLDLPKSLIIFKKELETMHDPNLKACFLVARITQKEIGKIKFGKEGQKWMLMPVKDFFERTDVVPKLKDRFRSFLESA